MKIKRHTRSVPFEPFLIRDLKNPRVAIDFLNAALDENHEDTFLLALHHVAQALGGISKVAKYSKIHRVTLHRILSSHGNPKLSNLTAILHALHFKLSIVPESPSKTKRAA